MMKNNLNEPFDVATIGTRATGKTVSDLTLAYKKSLKSDAKFIFFDFHQEADYNLDFIKPNLMTIKTITLSELDNYLSKPDVTMCIVKMYFNEEEKWEQDDVWDLLMKVNKKFTGTLIYEALMMERYIRINTMLKSRFKKASHVIQFTTIGDLLMYCDIEDFRFIKLHRVMASFVRYTHKIHSPYMDLLTSAHQLVTPADPTSSKDRFFYCVVDIPNRMIHCDATLIS